MENFVQYLLLICSFAGLFFSIMTQLDYRAGRRFMYNSKYRVKDNSLLRRVLPFKETEDNPYLYVKVVPVFINIIVFFTVLVIYGIFWILQIDLISEFLLSLHCVIVSVLTAIGPMLYGGILNILG